MQGIASYYKLVYIHTLSASSNTPYTLRTTLQVVSGTVAHTILWDAPEFNGPNMKCTAIFIATMDKIFDYLSV